MREEKVHYRGPWNNEILCGENIQTVKFTFKKEKVTCDKCLKIMYDNKEENEVEEQ